MSLIVGLAASVDKNAQSLTSVMITKASRDIFLFIVKESKEGRGRETRAGRIGRECGGKMK
jgi:hypothetical protein